MTIIARERTSERFTIIAKTSARNEYDRTVAVLASTPNAVGDQPALLEWDLSRFEANPVVLWAHDDEALPIGKAVELEVAPEGLKLRIRIATEQANPLAEQVWCSLGEGTVRAVSVGYELVGRNKARLLELSFVSIGLDEDAGTLDLNPAAELSDDARQIRAWDPSQPRDNDGKFGEGGGSGGGSGGGDKTAKYEAAGDKAGKLGKKADKADTAATRANTPKAYQKAIDAHTEAADAHAVAADAAEEAGNEIKASAHRSASEQGYKAAQDFKNEKVKVEREGADKASAEADKADTMGAHLAAEKAHAGARDAAKEAGDKAAEEHHKAKAEHHQKWVATEEKLYSDYTAEADRAAKLTQQARPSPGKPFNPRRRDDAVDLHKKAAALAERRGDKAMVDFHRKEVTSLQAIDGDGDGILNEADKKDRALEAEEKLKRKLSRAASALAHHRANLTRLRRAAEEKSAERSDSDHFDISRLDAKDLSRFEQTQVGGRVIPARLSRIGVLRYLQKDGTYRRELRLPEEVFKADSIRTLEHAPVIDFVHHREMVSPSTFKKTQLGTVTKPRREGDFLVGELRVDDAGALEDIADEERRDISLGYKCRLDWTPGEFEGQPYDCVQRDITYNHAALCPPNRGRAGPDVALRLDVGEDTHNGGGIAHLDDTEEDMTIKVRLDGVEVVEHSPEHFALVGRLHAVGIEKTRSDMMEKIQAETQRADKAEGERDGLKGQIEQVRTDAAEMATKADEKLKDKEKAERAFVRARRKLERQTIRYFGGPDDEEDEEETRGKREFSAKDEDEEETRGKRGFPQALKDELGVEDDKKEKSKRMKRTDADDEVLTDDRLDAMSDRELMIFGIKKIEPRFDANDGEGKPRSDDYIRARFDAAVDAAKAGRRIGGVVRTIEAAKRTGGGERRFDMDAAADELDKARKDRDKRAATGWQQSK